MEQQVGYIVKGYNKYDGWDRRHKLYAFIINENWYAVFSLEDGYPPFDDYNNYQVYKSAEAALEYVRLM